MVKLLVHVATGPENPTRAALALLVARTAAEEGHDVNVFLAGDAVQLVRSETAEVAQGIGTGSVRDHLAALAGASVPVTLSGLSSKARGVTPETAVLAVQLAPPQRLVELTFWADRTLTY